MMVLMSRFFKLTDVIADAQSELTSGKSAGSFSGSGGQNIIVLYKVINRFFDFLRKGISEFHVFVCIVLKINRNTICILHLSKDNHALFGKPLKAKRVTMLPDA